MCVYIYRVYIYIIYIGSSTLEDVQEMVLNFVAMLRTLCLRRVLVIAGGSVLVLRLADGHVPCEDLPYRPHKGKEKQLFGYGE